MGRPLSPTGYNVQDYASTAKDDLEAAERKLIESFVLVDPIKKNEMVKDALMMIKEAKVSTEEIIQICIKAR